VCEKSTFPHTTGTKKKGGGADNRRREREGSDRERAPTQGKRDSTMNALNVQKKKKNPPQIVQPLAPITPNKSSLFFFLIELLLWGGERPPCEPSALSSSVNVWRTDAAKDHVSRLPDAITTKGLLLFLFFFFGCTDVTPPLLMRQY
jgi:hypothetical protein